VGGVGIPRGPAPLFSGSSALTFFHLIQQKCSGDAGAQVEDRNLTFTLTLPTSRSQRHNVATENSYSHTWWTSKKQSDSPAEGKIPINYRDLFGDKFNKAK
jgi:hypothetical protein